MKGGFTLWFLPHDRTPPKVLHVSAKAFWTAVALAAVLLGAFVFHTVGYYRKSVQ